MSWYQKDKDQIFEELETDEKGLDPDQAEKRLEEQGENRIKSGEEISPIKIFLSQFQDFLIYLLILAALISLGIGLLPGHSPEYKDAGLIFIILIANGLFGFIQDYKAEKSIEALKELSTPDAKVYRDEKKKTVDSRNLVPGEIIFLESGDSVPADARLLKSENLETNESALTGESEEVSKTKSTIKEDRPLAERNNMVYMNTNVVKGKGKAVVVSTGMDTEVGNIADQIKQADEGKTPFQKEVDQLGKKIGKGIMGVILFVALIQAIFTSTSLTSILLISVTLAVAAVPEGLPAIVTLTLALGSKKILKRDALVRRLPVVESLGSVDVIVADKTGTLTEDKMTVEKIWTSEEEIDVTGTGTSTSGQFRSNDGDIIQGEKLKPILECGYLCNNAEKAPKEEDEIFYGEPTEIALLVSALKADIEFDKNNRIREIPFSSDRKRMTVVTNDSTAYMKGAPEIVLERCDKILVNGEERKLTDDKKQQILDKNDEMAKNALRVLGFARKNVENPQANAEELEKDLTFLGLQGMIDPPREEVNEAVKDSRSAGIRVVMATGDNVKTAKAIARETGFEVENAMTGEEIDKLSHSELSEKVEEVDVFARVSPEHKVKILKALQANGHNVAMTGDGVNDAPALKNSDVGIAMGERGTDVAQQSSDMILQDDNFVTIRDAVAEGRGIFDNIRKFVNYLLSANAGEVMTVFFGVLLGALLFPDLVGDEATTVILTPVMLLWINLVTDGLPALALGSDPKSKNIMDRKPRGEDEPVISKRIKYSIGIIGFIMALVGLPLFFYTLHTKGSILVAQTRLFTFLVLIELVRIQVIRSRYNLSIFSNNWLIAAIGSSILLQLFILYTPARKFFELAYLTFDDWLAIGISVAVFTLISYGLKIIFRRKGV